MNYTSFIQMYAHIQSRFVRFAYACISMVLPESEDERLVRRADNSCVSPRAIRKASSDVTICMDIDIPEVRALIRSVKYHGHPEATEKIAQYITPYLVALCEREHIDIIAPIPLSASRKRSRGYNQVAYVLSRCAELNLILKDRIKPEALTRVRHTKPQTSLTRNMRLHNMKGAFLYPDPSQQKVLIVDDVVTTGATLQEAKRAVVTKGGKVYLLAFAGR